MYDGNTDRLRRFCWDSTRKENFPATSVLESPIFFCGDGAWNAPKGTPLPTEPVVHVGGPLIDMYLETGTASAGALVTVFCGFQAGDLSAGGGVELLRTPVVTADRWPILTIMKTDPRLGAGLADILRSPAPYWRAVFENGASIQATCRFMVAGGGW